MGGKWGNGKIRYTSSACIFLANSLNKKVPPWFAVHLSMPYAWWARLILYYARLTGLSSYGENFFTSAGRDMGIQFGRAHLARQYVSGRMCSLRALLRERKVTGRDASLPAPWLSVFSILVARGTVGALPQTPQGTLSLDPSARLSWSLFLTSSACCSDFPLSIPNRKTARSAFCHRPRGSFFPITSAYKVRHSHSRRWSAYRPASHPRQ